MAANPSIQLGTDGNWAIKEDNLLAYKKDGNRFFNKEFDFSRATSATRVNKQGLIETVATDKPRIDFLNDSKGYLLLEPQSTNLITYSEDFSQWTATGNTTISATNITSPSGKNNATNITGLNGSGSNDLRFFPSGFNSANKTLSFSLYLKGSGTLSLQMSNGVDQGTRETITLTSNWKRHILTTTFNSTTSIGFHVNIDDYNSATATSYDIWGAQLEELSHATSYIPTSGSAVTRSAETCYQDNLLTDIINASYPFTMYAEAKAVIDDSQHFLTFSNRSLSNTYFTLVLNSDGTVKLDARVNGISEFLNSSATAITNGDFFKTAIIMESATSGKICVNGVLDSKTNFTQQAINTNINDLLVGMLRTVSDTGRRIPIKDVKLYNTALTDAELIALTS